MHRSRRTTLHTLAALAALPAARAWAQADEPLRLVTGDLPPMAMPGEPGQHGVLLDLVEMMFKRAEMPVRVEFYPWARALLMASERPRTLILPLNRTPEREARFQWLLKLYAQHFVFMSLTGKPRVDTIAQAQRLRIGGLRGSSNLGALHQQGLQPSLIYQAASIADMQRALERGLVDALYGSELIHTDAWRRSGRDPARLQVGFTLESADVWLAAQGGITEAELARLRAARDALLADGSVERLFARYSLKPNPDDLR